MNCLAKAFFRKALTLLLFLRLLHIVICLDNGT